VIVGFLEAMNSLERTGLVKIAEVGVGDRDLVEEEILGCCRLIRWPTK